MRCFVWCSLGIAFFIANLVVTFSADKIFDKKPFYKTLTSELITKYEAIIQERRDIYIRGYIWGLILALVVIFYGKRTKKLKFAPSICIGAGVTLLVNYLYYILYPKSDTMIVHLDREDQRVEWQKIYRSMQLNYHIGLVLGIIAAGFFSGSICAL
tara:strand:+ start:151 stop:618 length:468 start_codon:yes stop_codon:yes gene_type:complete